MASYSEGQGLIFINNSNINDTCLNRGRLHFHKKATVSFNLT